MKKRFLLCLLATLMIFLSSCVPAVGGPALARKDLSKVILQEADVPAEFRNMSKFNQQDAERFFQRGEEDKIAGFAGASYLNPQGGLNYIYTVVIVYDDETSAKNVYNNTTQQVNAAMRLASEQIGDESLLYSTPTGTSFFHVWRYQEAVGYMAIITRLQTGFDQNAVVAAAKLMQGRLEE